MSLAKRFRGAAASRVPSSSFGQALPRHWRERIFAAVVFLVAAAAIVVAHVHAYTALSPLDELQHVDYLYQASRFELVADGERVGQQAMREQACRTVDAPGFVSPPCDSAQFDPEDFQERGFNTAAQHPPAYYLVTGLLGRPILAITQIHSLVTAGRLVGILWLWSGMTVTWLLAMRIGARPLAATGAGLLLGASPVVVHASSTVNPDAGSLLAGGVLCLVVVVALERQVSPWLILSLAAFGTSIKVTNSLAILAALLFVLLMTRFSPDLITNRHPKAHSWFSRNRGDILVALVAGGVLPPLLWRLVGQVYATPEASLNPIEERFRVPEIGFSELGANLLSLTTPVQNPYLPTILRTPIVHDVVVVGGLLLLVAIAAAAWLGSGSPVADKLALATLLSMLLGGPLLVLIIFLGTHGYFSVPARYGLSLLPAAAAVLAVVASRRRYGAIGLAAVGAGTVAVILIQLL